MSDTTKTKDTLKLLRIRNHLTLMEASKEIGIGKDTLSNYERGCSYPTVKVLKEMERIYHVTLINPDINFFDVK